MLRGFDCISISLSFLQHQAVLLEYSPCNYHNLLILGVAITLTHCKYSLHIDQVQEVIIKPSTNISVRYCGNVCVLLYEIIYSGKNGNLLNGYMCVPWVLLASYYLLCSLKIKHFIIFLHADLLNLTYCKSIEFKLLFTKLLLFAVQ